MQGASRESAVAAQERLGALLASTGADPAAVGDELFAVVDLLDGQPALRASLTDPSRAADDKAALVAGLLAGKLSEPVVEYVAGTARSRWSAARDLADTFELVAVQAVLESAQRAGRLDDVEDELFRFSRIVGGEAPLRAALTDRALPAERKTELVGSLLADRASVEAARLVARAVVHPRGRQLEDSLEDLGAAASARRQRLVGTVTAAVPLTEQQRERLAAVLAAQFGHAVHLNVVIDPEVVGGLRVTLGDEVIDGTISTRLDEAARRLAG